METIKTITQLGSNWNNGSNAGSFYWNLNNSVGNRNRNIRGHLIIAKYSRVETSGYFYKLCSSFNRATRQNIKISGADNLTRNTVLLTNNKERSTVFTGRKLTEIRIMQIPKMKRYDHLYEKIYALENLRKAHQHAKKGKGWYREVQEIDKDPDRYLKQIQEMLINHTYKTSDYEVFYKQDGKKLRKIYKLPYFPDRICQWAILQVIERCIINNLTTDTYSAIPKRGIHKGLTKLQAAMWNDPEECKYCLKLDARHYYQSINHDLLKEKYSIMFNDNELMWLLNEIIDSIETAEIEDLTAIYLLEEDIDPETGIPIGNYLSQYSGNYYFSSFDHWIKEQKHVKYYFRYMDDIVIFGKTKEELIALKKEIDIYFRNELKLNIKGNWQVFPSYIRGVDFLGYRTFYKYTLLRKSTCLEMERKMTAIRNKVESGNMMNYSEWCSINSYKGWLKYADSFRLYQKYVVPLLPYADDYYIRNIKPNTKKGLNAA